MEAQDFGTLQGAVFPTDRPQGTPEELSALKMDLRDWGSCAPQGPQQKGCPMYADCPIPKWRDGFTKGKELKHGPAIIGVTVILGKVDGNAAGGQIMPCYDMFYRRLQQRRENAKKSGEVIRIRGVEGDDVVIREMTTRRLHETRAEGMAVNCDGCAKGECNKRRDVIKETNLKDVRFPRPKERFGGLTLAQAEAQEMLAELAREEDLDMLRAHAAQQQDEDNAKLSKR